MAIDHERKTASLDFLHPQMRVAAEAVVDELRRAGVPFRLFESYRSPERQAKLYAKYPRVTKARPWYSMHQYGCACDFVINADGVKPWSTKTDEHKRWWKLLHEAGDRYELRHLSWEKPHMQMANVEISELRDGVYPAGGDDPWVWNLRQAMDRVPKRAPRLPPEYDDEVLRPATDDGLELP